MLHCQACSPPVRAQSSVDLQVVRGAWLAASARLQSCIAAGASATAWCGPLATGAIQFDASIRCTGYVVPHTRLPERLSYVQHCFKVLPAQAAMKDLRCRGRAYAQPTSQSIAYTKLLNVCPRCSVLGAALFGWHSQAHSRSEVHAPSRWQSLTLSMGTPVLQRARDRRGSGKHALLTQPCNWGLPTQQPTVRLHVVALKRTNSIWLCALNQSL